MVDSSKHLCRLTLTARQPLVTFGNKAHLAQGGDMGEIGTAPSQVAGTHALEWLALALTPGLGPTRARRG